MNWHSITLFQYQRIILALQEEDITDRNSKLIGIINNWTDYQVDSLTIEDYNKEKNKLEFLNKDIEGKPEKYINVNGNKYKCIYDIRKLNSARYIESKVFSQDFISNLHKLAASMVMPMKRTIFGWKVDKYDASRHEDYAQDMLEVPITSIYHSIVFFYHVYRNLMEVSKDYLIAQLMKANKSRLEAESEVVNLLKTLDGNIAPNLLPTTTISKLEKLMNSQ
jgi:hypothetical protein